MKKLTKKLVIDYHEFMCEKFNIRLIKPCDPLPLAIRSALSLMHVDSDFLKKYAITIPSLDRKTYYVYIPWTPGTGKVDQLYYQVRKLDHECEHCVQGEDPLFVTHYLTLPAMRANSEALAMHPELELYYWYHGKAATNSVIAKLVSFLSNYKLSKEDIAVTYAHLVKYNKIVARGSVSSEAGKAAIKWLEERI
jgi:hypothetical protein